MNSDQNRIIWIDTLKGFATICVVLGHVVNGYMGAGFFSGQKQIMQSLYNGVYAFHIALLFALSGMTYRIAYFRSDANGNTVINIREKLRRQTLNLTMIYVFYSIVMGVFKIISAEYVNNLVSPVDLLFIWARPIYPYWYLYALIFYYIIFGFTLERAWMQNHPHIFLLAFAILSCLDGVCDTHGWFQIPHIMKNMLFFYFGIRTAEDGATRWDLTLIVVACSLAVFVLFRYYKQFYSVFSTVLAMGIVMLLIKLGSALPLCNHAGILSFLGKHSLEIYVLHCFFTAGNRFFLPKLGITGFYASVIVNLISSVAIPVIISIVSKKLKVYNLFFSPIKLLPQKADIMPDGPK